MKNDISPTETELHLVKVNNGWVIYAGSYMRNGSLPSETFVASKPHDLAELIHQWALQQGTAD